MKKIVANDGRVLLRRSRWIPILHNRRPSRRNRLWPYVTDGNGYREWQAGFDPSSGLNLDFFIWNNRNWAVEQFNSVNGIMGMSPIFFENEDGKTSFIAGYDSENYWNPILIELDDYRECVRVYEEV